MHKSDKYEAHSNIPTENCALTRRTKLALDTYTKCSTFYKLRILEKNLMIRTFSFSSNYEEKT